MRRKKLTDTDIASIVACFTPLVIATARRYRGRKAEFDDLAQEGYMQLVLLARECPDRRYLASYLSKRLPGAVRAAAARMWRSADAQASGVSMDTDGFVDVIAETTPDPDAERAYAEIELRATIERHLDARDAEIARALLEGATQGELALRHGVSPQTMSTRIGLIRNILRRYVV